MDQRTLLSKIETLFRNHRDRLGYGFSLALRGLQEKLERGETPTSEDVRQFQQVEDYVLGGSPPQGSSPSPGDLPPLPVSPEHDPFAIPIISGRRSPTPATPTTHQPLPVPTQFNPFAVPIIPGGGGPVPATPTAHQPLPVPDPFAIPIISGGRSPTPATPVSHQPLPVPTQFNPFAVPIIPGGGGPVPATPVSHQPLSVPPGLQLSPPPQSPPPPQPPPPPPAYQKPDTSKDDNWLNRLLNRLGGRGQDVKDAENKYLDTHKKLFEAQIKFNRAPQEFKFAEAEYERAFKDREAARQAGTLSAKESERVEEARRKLREARKGMQEAPDELAEAQKIHDQARADYRANKGKAGNRLGLGAILRGLGFENVGRAMGEEGEEKRLHQLAAAGNQQAAQQLGQLQAGRAVQGLQNIQGGAAQITPTAGLARTGSGVGQMAQGVGQTMMSMGGKAGTAGAVIAGLGMLVKGLADGAEKLQRWGDELQSSMYQIGQFSGAMKSVEAEEMRRNILLSQDRGNALAGSARQLMESRTRLARASAPFQNAMAGGWSQFLSMHFDQMSKILEYFGELLGIAKKGQDQGPDWAQDLADASMGHPAFHSNRNNWDWGPGQVVLDGRPQRFR